MFTSLLNTATGSLSITDTLICTGVSIVLGIVLSLIYMLTSNGKCTKSFAITLAILPAVIQMVIMMVNGNLGAGVAVMGAFSLVRFRSMPGTSKEICAIFIAMALGLATGMGYVTFAVLFLCLLGFVFVLLSKTKFGEPKATEKTLKITIPESLDYTDVFDDIFKKYTNKVTLDAVKTTNLGSMFMLTYSIMLKDGCNEKEMIDELRCRNGNLTITCARTVIAETL